jgi:putative DNA primase/helicase
MEVIDTYSAAQDALQFIPADLPYSDWRNVCFGLISEFGKEEGAAIFDSWSQGGGSYDSSAVRSVVRSADPNGPIKIGTLFHIAKQYGYQLNRSGMPKDFSTRNPIVVAEKSITNSEVQERGATASKAHKIWEQADRQVSPSMPYVLRKKIIPTENLREITLRKVQSILGYAPKSSEKPLTGDTVLVAPVWMLTEDGLSLSNVELIDGNSKKAALAGKGTKKGGFWAATPLLEGDGTGFTILIGEGVATVLSAHQATGYFGIASLSAGNLSEVAKVLRHRYPGADFVMLADKGNGQADAEKAARLINCRIAFPVFPENTEGKDFNDMAFHCDSAVVKAAIDSATNCSEDWQIPDSIDVSLPTVPVFDYALLPEKVMPYVRDVCDRMQCPPDYVAVSMMAALGTVIGRRVGIRPKKEDNWTEFANLWGMIIGRPSMKKSPAMQAGFAGLRKLEKKAAANLIEEQKQYQQDCVLAELRNKQIKSDLQKKLINDINAHLDLRLDEPEAPSIVRYTANNFSPEAVVEVLRHNPNGLLCYRDELIGILKTWEKEGQEDTRSLFLQGWSGNMPYTTDRIGRGLNLHVPAVCLSVFGSTQPSVIAEFVRHAVRGGVGDDGLIQRFGLMVYPDKKDEKFIKFVDQRPNLPAQLEMEALFEFISEATPEDFGAEQGEYDPTPFLRLDPEAYELFKEWNISNEQRILGGELHPALESHLSKYNKQVLGLALICHIASGGKGAVSAIAMDQALAWLEYLEPHAHRIFFAVNSTKVDAAKILIKRIGKGELEDGFTAREVYRKGWAFMSTQEEAQGAIDLLVEHGYLKATPSQSTGRSTIKYLINPRKPL